VTASANSSGTWPAQSASVPAARRLVREHLHEHDAASLSEDAELLVSELVANVVLHVGGTVEVTVRSGSDGVLLEVADASPVAPQLRSFSRTSSTGRGMRLVHALSSANGVRVQGQGKTVWVRLTGAAGRTEDELAESFTDVDWLAELEQADADDVTARMAAGV
jgi:anti-sigma regulatory factor (Ser/Thr protein kinase)